MTFMTTNLPGKVTICVVNYKTLELTRLCLRSIRKFTQYPYKIIVIDNDSQDSSTEYLKSLDWIHLVERKDKTNDSSGGYSHAAAMDMGLQLCDTEFFAAIHSDTVIHKQGWLGKLMEYFGNDPKMACVGAGKCELHKWYHWLKKTTDFKTLKRKLLKTPDPVGKYRYYNRTICSIYRTEILKKEKLSFLMDRDKGLTVGKKLYFELVDKGYNTVELPDKIMTRYIWHLAHATQVLNKGEFNVRKRTKEKTNRIIKKVLNNDQVKSLTFDNSLDK